MLLLLLQELLQQLQQWEQQTKQMLQEKEQQLNSVGCKRTVDLDRLTEMKRKVSRSYCWTCLGELSRMLNRMHGHYELNITEMRNFVQFREMQQVVMEDREEQEKLRQQQEEAGAATKVTTSIQNSD